MMWAKSFTGSVSDGSGSAAEAYGMRAPSNASRNRQPIATAFREARAVLTVASPPF